MNLVGYALFVAIGAAVALVVRKVEGRRLGYEVHPGYRLVGIGCLFGAVVGAKLSMLMYHDFAASRFDYTSKTVLGGLAGGYLTADSAKASSRRAEADEQRKHEPEDDQPPQQGRTAPRRRLHPEGRRVIEVRAGGLIVIVAGQGLRYILMRRNAVNRLSIRVSWPALKRSMQESSV